MSILLYCSLHNSFRLIRSDTLDKLRNKIVQIDSNDLKNDPNKFKDLYQFTFNFAKSPSQKSLDLEDAIAYWKMILADRFKHLDLWIQFLTVTEQHLILLLQPFLYLIVFLFRYFKGESQKKYTERHMESSIGIF